MSESVPSSVTGFAHRRPRADSVTSFTYFQEEDESPNWSDDQVIIDEEADDAGDAKHFEESSERDPESGQTSPQRRKSSGYSQSSDDHPLLNRHDSAKTDASAMGKGARFSQKVYVVSEDLTIVFAGFTTKSIGLVLYLTICCLTLGLGYLVLRWLPRWRVWLTGTATSLRECDWVVVEVRSPSHPRQRRPTAKVNQNQWGQFDVQNVSKTSYGYAASTVFGVKDKKSTFPNYDYDDDPVLLYLRFLDYRYIRFCFHPLKDKFVLCSDWKDPTWTDVRSIRNGLDSEERHRREQVFGKNQIEIEQKSIPQLLINEVYG